MIPGDPITEDLLDAYDDAFSLGDLPLWSVRDDAGRKLLAGLMREALARRRPLSQAELRKAFGFDPAGDGATKY